LQVFNRQTRQCRLDFFNRTHGATIADFGTLFKPSSPRCQNNPRERNFGPWSEKNLGEFLFQLAPLRSMSPPAISNAKAPRFEGAKIRHIHFRCVCPDSFGWTAQAAAGKAAREFNLPGRGPSNVYHAGGWIMMTVSNQTIIACWIIFIAYWAISAVGIKRAVERESRVSGLKYKAPLTLGSMLLWCSNLLHQMNPLLIPHRDLAGAISAVVCVFGLLVAIWSRRTLAGNWSSSVTFKQGHELIQRGPYRLARHPIYTGILLMCAGTAIGVGRLFSWLGLLILSAGFWIKLKQEESLLLRHFPGDYPSYRTRVKALVPFVI
jgi:protein-S-isoprenylcysteine O-methyltransferase Ste14